MSDATVTLREWMKGLGEALDGTMDWFEGFSHWCMVDMVYKDPSTGADSVAARQHMITAVSRINEDLPRVRPEIQTRVDQFLRNNTPQHI